eukprot:Mrub_06380.p1 GENE.Mrub_06380~~Mrub_06380.p1  ORF type:complete len:310 (-),score=25.07 Mrub_06380:90-914(-)
MKKEDNYQNSCIPNHLKEILNLNENSDNDPYIVPCKCEGDFKYAHRECMKMFIMAQNRLLLPKTKCELCKCDYAFDFRLKYVLDLSFTRHKAKYQLKEAKDNLLFLTLCFSSYILINLENIPIGTILIIFQSNYITKIIVSTILIMLGFLYLILLMNSLLSSMVFYDLVDWSIYCQQHEIGLHKQIEPEIKEYCMRVLQNEFWYKIDMNTIDIPDWMLAYFDIRLVDSRYSAHEKPQDKINNLDETIICSNNNKDGSMLLKEDSFNLLFEKKEV